MNHDRALREQLVWLLEKGHAHVTFEPAIEDIPADARGRKPPNVPHSPWRLLEHMRIAQWDILEFSRNPEHISPEFPDGYWPDNDAPPDERAWDESIRAFRADLQAMQDLITGEATDLFAPIPHGRGQTLLREALLLADHNAYHVGQLVVVRRALGCWPDV